MFANVASSHYINCIAHTRARKPRNEAAPNNAVASNPLPKTGILKMLSLLARGGIIISRFEVVCRTELNYTAAGDLITHFDSILAWQLRRLRRIRTGRKASPIALHFARCHPIGDDRKMNVRMRIMPRYGYYYYSCVCFKSAAAKMRVLASPPRSESNSPFAEHSLN